MRPTPAPVTSGPAPAIHQFDVDGGAKAPPDRTETAVSNPLPHISETTVRSILHIGDNATIIRYVTEGVLYPTPIDRLVFTATSPHASIFVTQGSHDTLTIDLNHERYSVKPASDKQMIEIHTRNGHDTVYIVDTLKNPFHIETGAGNDTVVTNAQHATVLTGDGNDIVMTGAGDSYINTGAGNDIVNASSAGTTVAYTGKGADFFRGGAGTNFVDTGDGDDVAVGGPGHNILCGGDGDDLLTAGSGSNVIYTGKGQNILDGIKDNDKIFTESAPSYITDGTPDGRATTKNLPAQANTYVMTVTSTPLSESGLIIQGSEAFIERVQDDLKLLLGSANGQKLITELTKSIRKSQKPITIAELKHVNNGLYIPNLGDGRSYIEVGQAGLPDFGGTVYYNPSFATPHAIPLTALYHELCHAYNYVTGTQFSGASPDGHGGVKQAPQVKNIELQAVGLPCGVEPFDFDKDPATPPTTTNPKPYSENGMREELGLPLRKTYIRYSKD